MSAIHDPAYKRFLKTLREARQVANVSQEELAKRLGKHQTYVSKVERGQKVLDLLDFLTWARELGAEPMTLLDGLAKEIAERRIRSTKRPRTQLL